ncbi:MAG: hypothetical protein CHACPFDD_00411 [Phycisphaerae bacterium]|nr:hypothetical protein [Phycisphaerae bacterium]
MFNLQIERLRKLPQRMDDTWQAAIFRMPMWIQDDDGRPARPWTALCVSTRTGMVGLAEPRLSSERTPKLVLDSVKGLATGEQGGYRPGRLEVRQAEVAGELRPILADIGVEVVEMPELQALDDARQGMTKHFMNGRDDPAALLVHGVTVTHLRGFAEAAKEFHEAAPWRHLSDEDLIEVVSPLPGAGLELSTVMGAAGRQFGLAFFDSRQLYNRMFEVDDPGPDIAKRGVWSFTFEPMVDLPIGDADAWEDHGLAVASDDAYPFLARLGPGTKVSRPTPKQWVFVEGLLRALARSTEPEMDCGRWSKTVPTISGEAEYILTLPALLEPIAPDASQRRSGMPDRRALERSFVDIGRAMEGMQFASVHHLDKNFTGKPVAHRAGRTPLERAQDLAYDAVEARGRRQLQLVRKALEISRDCADAYVLLAERTSDIKEARDLYAQGVAAGERALGAQALRDDVGHFWGMLETRPYMRARLGLAYCCERLEQLAEAAAHYDDMLRLNPNDNQGVRFRLAHCLSRGNDLDRLEAVLRAHDEESAQWQFLWAFWAFRKHGDCDESRKRLSAAHARNRHVRKYLLGNALLPDDQPNSYRFGDDSEAVIVASEMMQLWENTPDALSWLDANTRLRTRKRQRRKS